MSMQPPLCKRISSTSLGEVLHDIFWHKKAAIKNRKYRIAVNGNITRYQNEKNIKPYFTLFEFFG